MLMLRRDNLTCMIVLLKGCFCSYICRSYIETALAVGRCFCRDDFYACTRALGKYVAWHHN